MWSSLVGRSMISSRFRDLMSSVRLGYISGQLFLGLDFSFWNLSYLRVYFTLIVLIWLNWLVCGNCFIMDPSDDTVAKPRNDSVASENSLASNLGAVAGSSLDEVKNTISSVAANESVQGVWSQVRYLAGGRSGGESQGLCV
ncbi:hypothetical protein BDV25DRAFT_159823 [Aspergillus avenaceus]|uniref:Uncharacterized protein n=1 Tax=Aspergillus avenaceus TaxID=36643 RepID=A0A5N6TMV5_ASPAV|nr:hypothetical protein BDV25DRAFT_159823 [Aspergillus avenaceus]